MSIDREKLLSIGVMKKSKDAGRDRQLSKDLDAYKRLRKQGMQPPRIDGSARLESEAVSDIEIRTGVVPSNLSAEERRKMAKRLDSLDFSPAVFLK